MIFVNLQVGMKEKLLRLSAMLLVLWYCFSVIGFNVHTCRASGRSFIATFVSGLSCSDIHPEHSCGHDHSSCASMETPSCCQGHGHSHETPSCCHSDLPSCCSSHDEMSFECQDCCDDDHLALKLTGCVSEKANSIDQVQQISVHCLSDVHDSVHTAMAQRATGLLLPVRGLTVPWDYQSRLGIWRI